MMDLTTTYLGFKLKNPIVASSSPLWESVSNIRALEDSGVSAVVLPSIFEEQLLVEGEHLNRDLARGTESFGEALSYLPVLSDYNLGPAGYLELIRKAKSAVSIPVVASLNGTSRGGWLQYARDAQQAGCDAIELNLYSLVTDPLRTSVQVENDYCDLVRELKKSLRVPVAVKLSHFLTAPANLAGQLDVAGANALVLFNRFYQPDFDIEQMEVIPRLALSHSQELLLRLHWVAIIYGRVQSDLAITGGVHTAEDVIKSTMAGAKVAMMTSALLQNGVRHASSVIAELVRWMDEHQYESIQQMRGSMSYRSAPDPAAFERVNYMRTLSSYTVAREDPAA
ncbi:MAG TPA: dihydroorotate dehydrogenase-like protein [Candidatus Acidoferrum sp.]|nr:dihydroorotate dehydrogenase-like protein [Candidatus Acidoferrum sp.]